MTYMFQVIMKETDGDGIGRICEMSGSDLMVNSMFSMLRKGGRVVMVGLPKKPLHVENVLPDIGRQGRSGGRERVNGGGHRARCCDCLRNLYMSKMSCQA